MRFYQVAPFTPGQPSFEACLKKIKSLGPNPAREVSETIVQAGELTESGDRYAGDLVRLQTDNLPSLVENKGRAPKTLGLAADAALGHHAAFMYDASIKMLAYQFTKNSVSLGRFNAYIQACCGCDLFAFYPVIQASDLKQLNKMTPKTLLLKVADPDGLDAVESDEKKLKAALKNLRELADGMYVKIQVGLANKKGQLSKKSLSSVVGFLLGQRDSKRGKVQTIQIIGKDLDQDDVPLDFIKAQIGESETLSLGSSDPSENYKKRRDFIEQSLDKRFAELKKFKVPQ